MQEVRRGRTWSSSGRVRVSVRSILLYPPRSSLHPASASMSLCIDRTGGRHKNGRRWITNPATCLPFRSSSSPDVLLGASAAYILGAFMDVLASCSMLPSRRNMRPRLPPEIIEACFIPLGHRTPRAVLEWVWTSGYMRRVSETRGDVPLPLVRSPPSSMLLYRC